MTAALADFRGVDASRGDGAGLAWRLRQPLVPVAKRTLRAYGTATAAQRPLPDFLVIGAKRGGSTSLFRNLIRTPAILPLFPQAEDLKGTYYFDVFHERGERWYRSHFASEAVRRRAEAERGRIAVGEASPYYLAHPHAAARAAALIPGARIVALLRDPVARAHSHYRERVKQGIETLPTFEAAVEAEAGRLAGEVDRMLEDPSYVSWNHLNFGYLDQSRYDVALARWREHFPAEQVLVLASEDFYADPGAVLGQVRTFLGLPPHEVTSTRHYHQTDAPDLDPAFEAHLHSLLEAPTRA